MQSQLRRWAEASNLAKAVTVVVGLESIILDKIVAVKVE